MRATAETIVRDAVVGAGWLLDRSGLVNRVFENIHANHVYGDTHQKKSRGDPKCRQPKSHGV